MPVVNIPSSLMQHTQNQNIVEVTAETLYGALTDITKQYPALNDYIFTADNTLCSFMGVYINDKLVRDLKQSVSEQDEIMLVPAVAGG